MNKSGFSIVNDGGKFGLLDKEGRQVTPCIYDKILDYDDDGYIRVLIGDVYGTINLDGKDVILHSAGITHLGVFHGGTARAKKKEKWGLVDEKGNDVTEFSYQYIKAHYNNGYSAIDATGQYGWLSEKGEFTPSEKWAKTKPKYKRIAAYRNGVAPALTNDGKWIFIDKDQNRVGCYEYTTIDPVLRQGLYLVIDKEHMYNLCKFDGEPLLSEWYDHIWKFENGYAIFWKGIRDEDGKLKIFEGGQPTYMHGIIDLAGNYVVAPNYTQISWANLDKEYWYAERYGAKYYLYPDGRRFLIMLDGPHEVPKDPPYSPYNYRQELNTLNPVFDKDIFMERLVCWIRRNKDDVKFFYRDTNLEFDVENVYRPGTIIRAGQYLEMTDKLRRPIHNTRFVIASNHVPKVSDLKTIDSLIVSLPFSDGFLHFNSCFMVMKFLQYGGVDQVLVLHLPYGAVSLAEKKGISNAMFQFLVNEFSSLIIKAEEDLQYKMGELVHGYSLSPDWQKRMAAPMGYDQTHKHVPLESQDRLTDSEKQLSDFCIRSSGDYSSEWTERNFLK